mmetsp:Transcript_35807/g.94053  ORF Transcript_35807/g.94053 Transcript_35807/m.94053 type:complete len:402 (+) Transcript_35807:494-1699(+)
MSVSHLTAKPACLRARTAVVDLHGGRGEIGMPADVWAIGCMLFTLAFQRHPFGDQTLGIINGRFYYPPTSPYSPRINGLIDALLQPDPAKRPLVAPCPDEYQQLAVIARVTQALAEVTQPDLTDLESSPGRVISAGAGRPVSTFPAAATADLLLGADLMGDDLVVQGPLEGETEDFQAAPDEHEGWADFDGGSIGLFEELSGAPQQQQVPTSCSVDLLDMSMGNVGIIDAPNAPMPAQLGHKVVASSADELDFFGLPEAPAQLPVATPTVLMSSAPSTGSLSDDFDSIFGTPRPIGDLAAVSAPALAQVAVPHTLNVLASVDMPMMAGVKLVTTEPDIRPGQAVVVRGLQAKPEYNGCCGVLLHYDSIKARYSVDLDGVKVSLKRANVDPVRDTAGQPVFA